MKTLALTAATVALGLFLYSGESLAKGGSGGSSGGNRGGSSGGNRGGSRVVAGSGGHSSTVRTGHVKPVKTYPTKGTGHAKPTKRYPTTLGSGHMKPSHHHHNISIRIRLQLAGGGNVIPLTTRVIGEDIEEAEDANGEDAKGVEDSKGVEDAEPGKDLFGLEIVELSAGPAHKKGMKVGDIILAINGTATPDTESLQSVLQEAGSQAEVDFINVDNGELERIILRPMSGRIGAAVKQVKVE